MELLIVDDQLNIISYLMNNIPWYSLGFSSVYTANSVAEARTVLERHTVDILITDIAMPQEDGISLLHWVRDTGRDTECILLTSHADFFYAQQAISLGVTDYIIQPARDKDVIRAVKKALAVRAAKAENSEMRRYRALDFPGKNVVIRSLLDGWPDREKCVLEPEALEERLAKLRAFLPQCGFSGECVLLYIRAFKWHRLPLTPDAFFDKYRGILSRDLPDLRDTSLTYFADDNSCYTVLFQQLTDTVCQALEAAFLRLQQQLGCELRMLYCQADLHHISEGIKALYYEENAYGMDHPTAKLMEITLETADLDTQSAYDRYHRYMRSFRSYIEKNISQPITRTQIAEAFFLSPSYVSHIIKVTEDTTCKELITRIKMDYARNLLRSTDCPIGDVAAKCGYDSFAYFSKVYKQTFSITPSAERRR